RLARAAPQSAAAVDQSARYARALARSGGHGHGIAQHRTELDCAKDHDQKEGRKDQSELDEALGIFALKEADHSCGSARVMDASVNVTPLPVRRAKLVSQKC